MIRLEGVEKVYDLGSVKIPALGKTDLAVEKGELVSIMGPSGSGKSTLLHLLGMLDTPSGGTYTLEGHDVTALSDRERSRIRNRHFGFIFQSFNLLPEFNAVENVMLPLSYSAVPAAKRRERALELLDRMGLSGRAFHYPNMMSGGEQQRVAIARALSTDPGLILADEPTGNLPQEHGRQILTILRQLNDGGVTVVFVTHDEGLGRWAKRLIRLEDGKITSDAPNREVRLV